MKIRTFEVPYDTGRKDYRMGLGPASLLRAGLVNRLRFLGHEVQTHRIRLPEPGPSGEIASCFALARRLAEGVASEGKDGLTLVLSGNCNAALGTLSGLDAQVTGVLWFDAHGEFHTPETTQSGFLDGMGLATATGACWRTLAEQIPGYSRLPAKNLVLLGIRDVEEGEQAAMDTLGVQQLPAVQLQKHGPVSLLEPVLRALERRVQRLYLHFDLDVLDAEEARWNQWSTKGGIRLEDIEGALELLAGGNLPIAGVGIASHDPEFDPDRCSEAARRVLDRVLAIAGA